MYNPFRKVALAVAFSPTLEALLAESKRIKEVWNSSLFLIHVGNHTEAEEHRLAEHLNRVGLVQAEDVRVHWESGNTVDRILHVCEKENVDLLIAGALKKENLLGYYIGTVARKLMRKANCSVFMISQPSLHPEAYKQVVVQADESPFAAEALKISCALGIKYQVSWVHVVSEIKLYGLRLSAANHYNQDEYEELKERLYREQMQRIESMLREIPHEGLKINMKMVTGKSGFELVKFARRKSADLLVIGASPRPFYWFDRVFTHDQEYIFADLPCNLLMVHPRKH